METTMKKTMGMRIRELRLNKGLTQISLAKWLNVGNDTVCHWEKDRVRPNPMMLQEIARFFDVTPAYLTPGDTTPAPEPAEPVNNPTLKSSIPTMLPKRPIVPVAEPKRYSAADKRKLEDLELLIKHLPDLRIGRDEKMAIYMTVAELRDELAIKVLFGEV